VVPGIGGAAAAVTVRLLLDNPCAGTATPASCVALNDGDVVLRSDVPLTATTRTKLIEVPGLALDRVHELASVCKAIHGGGNATTYSDPLLLKLCSCPPAPTCTGDGAAWQLCANLPDDAPVPSRLQLQSCVGEVALQDAPVTTLPGHHGVGVTVLAVAAAVRHARYRRVFELPDGLCPGPWSLPLSVSWTPQPIPASSVEALTLDVILDARMSGAAVTACVGFEVQRAESRVGVAAAGVLRVAAPVDGQGVVVHRWVGAPRACGTLLSLWPSTVPLLATTVPPGRHIGLMRVPAESKRPEKSQTSLKPFLSVACQCMGGLCVGVQVWSTWRVEAVGLVPCAVHGTRRRGSGVGVVRGGVVRRGTRQPPGRGTVICGGLHTGRRPGLSCRCCEIASLCGVRDAARGVASGPGGGGRQSRGAPACGSSDGRASVCAWGGALAVLCLQAGVCVTFSPPMRARPRVVLWRCGVPSLWA
jgi:hypothetical protein